MKTIDAYKEDAILLVEAGFIAVNQADEDSAQKLFSAAELLNSSNPLCKIGFGYLHLHKLELIKACQCFESVLQKDPHNEMAKAMLGLSLTLQPDGSTKGEQILEQTVKSKDPLVKRLSESSLSFVEKFVKKASGPAGSPTKQK